MRALRPVRFLSSRVSLVNITAAFNCNAIDLWAVGLEYALYAFAVGHFSYCECGVDASVFDGNNNALASGDVLWCPFTFTCTAMVSPGENGGMSLPAICSFSICLMMLLIVVTLILLCCSVFS